jgi:SAM-dependent MidA family methyltransferase
MHNPLTTLVRERGPMTVAAFTELALYDPLHGYYSTSRQRSGAAGDFFTNVDVGPLFGEMLAVQIAEVWTKLKGSLTGHFDLVEAGAGNGRLTRDILDTAARDFPSLYDDLRATVVERSASARQEAFKTLCQHTDKVHSIGSELPYAINGVVIANELLDAFPVHVLTMTPDGVREVYIVAEDGGLRERIGPVSDPRLDAALSDRDLPHGWRGELSLDIPEWVHRVASALVQGFLVCFDYASSGHAPTLLAYSRHVGGGTSWLDAPGTQDISSHIDLAALFRAATEAGLEVVGCVDQTYFLTALGLLDRLPAGGDVTAVRRRLAARTLIAPGGLGSTMKAICFTKGVEGVALRGFESGRLT